MHLVFFSFVRSLFFFFISASPVVQSAVFGIGCVNNDSEIDIYIHIHEEASRDSYICSCCISAYRFAPIDIYILPILNL